jgi:hypothetical protein
LIFRDFDPIFVNVQPPTASVTDSTGGFPEQLILFKNEEVVVHEIISKSDLSSIPILSKEDGKMIYETSMKIHRVEVSKLKLPACVNIEFIIKNSMLFIIQIRPVYVK